MTHKQSHHKYLKLFGLHLEKLKHSFFLKDSAPRLNFDEDIISPLLATYGNRGKYLADIYFLKDRPKGIVVYVNIPATSPNASATASVNMSDVKNTIKEQEKELKDVKGFRFRSYNVSFTNINALSYVKNSPICILDDEERKKPLYLISNIQLPCEMIEYMKPDAFMVKFDPLTPSGLASAVTKLPSAVAPENGVVTYFEGDLFIQPFSNNTYLIGSKLKKKEYDVRAYQERLYYFNARQRFQKYDSKKDSCNCYDCASERMITK